MFKYQNNHNMKKSMYLIVISLLTGLTGLQSQEAVIELTFTATYQGQHVALDSILIQNLSQNCEMMTADTVIALDYVTGAYNKPVSGKESLQVSQNHPNPFTGQTMITIHLPGSDHLRVSVTNLFGQRVALFEQKLEAGSHSFIFYPGNDRYYVLSATVPGAMDVIKMINLEIGKGIVEALDFQRILWGQQIQFIKIEMASSASRNYELMGISQLLSVPYTLIAGSLTLTDEWGKNYEITMTPSGNLSVKPVNWSCGKFLNDARDGKKYPTVQIGSQCWMAKNLDFGIKISLNTNQGNNGVVEKYCDEDECLVYGGLYQWQEAGQFLFLPAIAGQAIPLCNLIKKNSS
jgi:hypothetical protein